jgi:glucosamine--fructose-6-phosphate aminotransferase (isomerizing)
MCGILGISFQDGCTMTNAALAKHILRELLREAEGRGTDATGVAFIHKKEIAVIKAPMRASDFIKTREFGAANLKYFKLNKSDSVISVIGHCRSKTKGTPLDNNNNHPIVTKNIVGVHNGVISNDEELFAKFQGYSKEFGRRGKVDSEIIFRLIDYFANQMYRSTTGAIQEMSDRVKGSYACATVERQNPYLLWLFRRVAPLTVYHYDKCGVLIFTSLENSIKNVMKDIHFRDFLGNPRYIMIPQQHFVL